MGPGRPKTVVRISTPADVLGVVPHRVGFHPTESIVVICLHGPRRRDGLVMRLDLAPPAADDAVASDLATKAAHVKATAVLVVCYTEEPGDGSDLPRRALVDALLASLRERDIEVLDALLVHDGRWWSYHCTEPACCPPEGTPVPAQLTEAAAHFAAEAVVEGGVVLAGRDELAASIRPPRGPVLTAARAQALERAGRHVVDVVRTGGSQALRVETVDLLRALVRRWADGSRQLDVDEAARVVLGLGVKDARDEAATLLLEAQPDVLLALLTALARHADLPEAAPVCTVLAWVAYAHGHGALANVALERALAADPAYEMARLLQDGLLRMITPAAVRAVTRDVRRTLETPTGPPALRPAGPSRPREVS